MTNEPVIDPREDVLKRGPCAVVAYACRLNWNRPAKDYIENLQQQDQATLARYFKQIADTGRIINKERFRKLRGKIWEFKVHPGIRVLCFQQGKFWLLTHGFKKQSGKTPPKEIERAEDIRNEHMSLLS
jgi:phage-related protein